MEIRRSLLKLVVSVLLLSATFVSCKKESDEPVYDHYISSEVRLQLTKEYMSGLVDVIAASYPEVADIKALISNDVNVFKITYKTVVNGQQVNASGLVCVPDGQGEYPVLSFQNGTNTLNSSAPSENPDDYYYQMIELLASIGYVVVIPDYPGFGESASIPHPYLIVEPTVNSITDMFRAVKEFVAGEEAGITLLNDYYLLGYSQGGWATLALHKTIELEMGNEFNLRASACGAGPYNISLLMEGMIDEALYPMPVYIGYIVNAYTEYSEFTNPVTDLLNEPYASRIGSLYNGTLTSDEINAQLTTSISDLINPDFLSGFISSPAYSSVRDALAANSITGWHSYKPLLLLHGENDTHVNPSSTIAIYDEMTNAGTSGEICKKVLIPGADHGSGVVPAMIQGILFLNNIKLSE